MIFLFLKFSKSEVSDLTDCEKYCILISDNKRSFSTKMDCLAGFLVTLIRRSNFLFDITRVLW